MPAGGQEQDVGAGERWQTGAGTETAAGDQSKVVLSQEPVGPVAEGVGNGDSGRSQSRPRASSSVLLAAALSWRELLKKMTFLKRILLFPPVLFQPFVTKVVLE